MSQYAWLELREPRCVPIRKGPFQQSNLAEILREYMDARPKAFITVVTIHRDGPHFEDGPQALEIIDGRSSRRAARHRKTSAAAFAECGP